MRLSGSFFEALSAKQLNGEIELFDKTVTIYVGDKIVCSGIGIKSFQDKKDIYLDNGFLFTLEYPLTKEQNKILSSDIARGINWLEKFSLYKASILAIVLVCSLFVLRYSLTLVIPLAVHIFPVSWEQEIGKNTYNTLNQTVLENSDLSTLKIDRLKKQASNIAQANGFKSPDILFHKSDLIGANALAFPAGPIVITDDLVLLLQSDDLILSVIAHEFAHVQERHSLQQIIEIVGIAAIASVILGSDDTFLEEASVVGINLWASKKSREFEKEADLLALKYMETAKLNKSAFGLAIKKLTEHFCSSTVSKSVQHCADNYKTGWLSTHPSGAERMEYLSDLH
ncbi:MAG: M48 family metallopeptidase [Gammaproteobacteria bacterium]|nr:M48 family metallopeptidase [Gammaproteobacteria bacterium]